MFCWGKNIMLPRLHRNFPTAQEAADNSDCIYSDNSPLLISLPLSQNEPPINLISLNVLDAYFRRNCSGFNMLFEESIQAQELRYEKIIKGLLLGKETNKADIMCFQDANPILVRILSKSLTKNWKIISNAASGLITLYNASQFDQLSKPINNTQKKMLSLKLKHRKFNSIIEVHNVRCRATYFPEEKEKEVAYQLRYIESDFSIVVGCIGQKMADLTRVKKNLITSIDSLKTSQELGLHFAQIGNFSNGAFLYNKKEKKLSQLSFHVLNFETGQIIEESATDLASGHSDEYHPIMRLDDVFKNISLGEKNISKYQYELQAFFKDDSIRVLPIVNINNELGVGVYFHEGSPLYQVLLDRLADNSNFKFLSIGLNNNIFEFECVFILNNQENEFYKVVEQIKQETLFLALKNQILNDIAVKSESLLSQKGLFFRESNNKEKIKIFSELYASINAVKFDSQNMSFKDVFNSIIREWEKPFANKKTLATHGCKLKKKNNDSLTGSEKIVREIKKTINSADVNMLYNFREDIIHRLIHEIARLDKKKKHKLAINKKICLEKFLDDIEQVNLDTTVGFFYKKLIAWEESIAHEKDTNSAILQKKKGITRMCPFFSSSSYNMVQKLKMDMHREALRNGEALTQ